MDVIGKVSAPLWWKEYGGECVELQHVATRVLFVAVSSGSCERNWSAFDFIHTKRRNGLNPARTADLVYIFCNQRLIQSPKDIATRGAQSMCQFQTHESIAEERMTDDEMEWEIISECSDVDPLDDLIPIIDNSDVE